MSCPYENQYVDETRDATTRTFRFVDETRDATSHTIRFVDKTRNATTHTTGFVDETPNANARTPFVSSTKPAFVPSWHLVIIPIYNYRVVSP